MKRSSEKKNLLARSFIHHLCAINSSFINGTTNESILLILKNSFTLQILFKDLLVTTLIFPYTQSGINSKSPYFFYITKLDVICCHFRENFPL